MTGGVGQGAWGLGIFRFRFFASPFEAQGKLRMTRGRWSERQGAGH